MSRAGNRESSAEPPARGRPKAPERRIKELLDFLEGRLKREDFKPSVADFIRLLQIHKEFEKQKPRNIEVTWIDAFKETYSDAE